MGCKKLNHCSSVLHTPECKQPLNHCCIHFRSNYNNVIKQITLEKQYDIKYYEKPIVEDFKLCGHKSNSIFVFLINFIQLLASVMALVIIVYGVLALADIVFQESSNIDATINNVLLALIPTVAVYAGAWLGKGVIFDLKEDLKELKLRGQNKLKWCNL